MILATLIGVWLAVVLISADLHFSARHARPKARKAEERDDARRAVVAAEQLHRGKPADANQDRARDATAHLLEMHPKMKPTRARLLVEHAVSEARK